MAFHLTIFIHSSLAERVKDFYLKEDTVHIQHSDEWHTFVISNSVDTVKREAVVADRGSTEASIFGGFAIDYAANRLIFPGAPVEHLPKVNDPIDGSYFRAESSANGFSCSSDVMGYDPLLWTDDPNMLAVSDSLLSLVTLRRRLNLPVTPNHGMLVARQWMNAMGSAQLNHETICNEVNFVTPRSTVSFSVPNRRAEVDYGNLSSFLPEDNTSHSELVRTSAIRTAQLISSLAAADANILLAMSGGLDSRLCLGAAFATGTVDALNIGTQNNGSPDYDIALSLADRFGFELNPKRPEFQGSLSPVDELATWATTSLGIYDQMYAPNHFRVLEKPTFSIGGQGAEAVKGNFGWRPLAEIEMPREALVQAAVAVSRLGIDPADEFGSEWHYLAFRNGLHASRALLFSDYCVRPTAQLPAIGLSRSKLNELDNRSSKQYSAISDALVLLSPELAQFPYDKSIKNISEATANARLQRLGGVITRDEIVDMAVSGTPAASKGVTQSLVNDAVSLGITGRPDAANLTVVLDNLGFDMSNFEGTPLASAWSEAKDSSAPRLPSTGRPATAAGKILANLLVSRT